MNSIIDVTVSYFNHARVKTSSSGWLSRNAPCCHHRGHNQDVRGRGGLKIAGDSISYNCFNCHFTCNYTVGRILNPKFINFLDWLGVDDQVISQLKLVSLQFRDETPFIEKQKRNQKTFELPDCVLLSDNTELYPNHIEYINSRGLSIYDYPYLISSDFKYRNRVIIPFIKHDSIVGFSARSIVQTPTRYIMKLEADFVFGTEFSKHNDEWIILSEGLFDAISMKGLAVMHNVVSEGQQDIINDLNKRIIVVPQLDESGLTRNINNSMINAALDNNWHVAIPEWECKDLNDAFKKYGRLFCMKHILTEATNNSSTIQVKQQFKLRNILNGIKESDERRAAQFS